MDEPVRRYFDHAIRDGAPHPEGVHLTMTGRIKAGLWLPFAAEQEVDGRSFEWRVGTAHPAARGGPVRGRRRAHRGGDRVAGR